MDRKIPRRPEGTVMIEFNLSRNDRSIQLLIIALGVIVILLGTIFLYVRYQHNMQPKTGAPAWWFQDCCVPAMNFEYYKNRF
jgi:hypothetical protein